MSKELVEGSVDAQVRAIEAWALGVLKESNEKLPKLDLIYKNLKMINLQGRKLQWRGAGIHSLPKIELTERLDKTLSEIRAAAMQAYGNIKHEKKITFGTKKYIKTLNSEAINARKLVGMYAQLDLAEVIKDEVKLEQFFYGVKDYAAYPLEVRRKLWNDFVELSSKKDKRMQIQNLELSNLNLSEFKFDKFSLKRCAFIDVDLSTASFTGANIEDCTFKECTLHQTNFVGCRISSTRFLQATALESKFTDSDMVEVVFSGYFDNIDFKNVQCGNLTFHGHFDDSDFRNARLLVWNIADNSSFNNVDLRNAEIELVINKYNFDFSEYKLSFSGARFSGVKFKVSFGYSVDSADRNKFRTAFALHDIFVGAKNLPSVRFDLR